jgi:drug/metabolite transporter (DMT)-like permease
VNPIAYFRRNALHVPSALGWGLLALAAHTAWGLYSVMARYLQTVSRLPTLTLAGVGNALVLIVLLVSIYPKLPRGLLKEPMLWALAAVSLGRAVTNLLSARFAPAVYVQLVNLSAPFLVALFSATLFHERIPRFTLPALFLCLGGALLMLSAEIGAAGVRFDLSASDWLGLAIAAVSSVFLALYMILARRCFHLRHPGEAIFFSQILSLTICMNLGSLAVGEDLGRWAALQPSDWAVFAAFVVVALAGANTAQIMALKHLSAPVVGSLSTWRLLSALAGSALLMGEGLKTVWQGLGAVIVMATVTWYLWQQSR